MRSFGPVVTHWKVLQCRHAVDSFAPCFAKRWPAFLLLLLLLSFTGRSAFAANAENSSPMAPTAGLLAIPSEGLKDSSYTFPITSVGHTSSSCHALCFCSDVSRCNCDIGGTETLQHPVAPPFLASGYLLQSYANGNYNCTSGTPVQLPISIGAGQQIAFTVSFSPTSPGVFGDYLRISDYTLNLSGSTPRGSANLIPYQPANWSAPLVVSDTPGTLVDSAALTSAKPLYISWAVLNAGDLSTFGTFYIDIYLDGAFSQRWRWDDPLAPHIYLYVKDYQIGPIAAGVHTIELIPDPTHVVGASPHYTKTFTVSQPGPASKPTTSTSWYVTATGQFKKDRALNEWAMRAGQQAGQSNQAARNSIFVILDFLQPWSTSDSHGTTYGASGYGRPLSVSQISSVVKAFILGYETVTQSGLTLAVGTTNNGPDVTEAHARAWARMVVELADWSTSQRFNVNIASANDAEIHFTSGPKKTQAWFRAFSDEVARSGHQIASYNYGDAAGCPLTTATSTPGNCDSPWTQKDIADLFAWYIPQIYAPKTALEWGQISLYIDLRSGNSGTLIRGPLSQLGACTPERPECRGAKNTPLQAWMQMGRALNSSTITAPGVQQLQWSTDIDWNQ